MNLNEFKEDIFKGIKQYPYVKEKSPGDNKG